MALSDGSFPRRGIGAVQLRRGGDPAPAHRILSDEEAVSVARAYAGTIAAGAADRDRRGTVPYAELEDFDRSGLAAITVPRSYGGADVSPRTLAEVIRTIAEVDPSVAQIPQGHYLFVDVLRVLGTSSQRQRLYGDVVGGARIGGALAERGGRHAQELRTRLRDLDGELRLSGRKYYSTGAISARWIAVTALDASGRLVLTFVNRDDPGITIHADWHGMGQRATVSGTTELEGVLVDRGLVLDYWRAFEGPQLLGARAQLVHAAIQVGIARGALRDAGEFVRVSARPFFEAVYGNWAERAADDPHTIHRYGRLATVVSASEQMLAWAAGVLEEIGPFPVDLEEAARGSLAVAQAKAFGSEAAVQVSSELFSLVGASGTDSRHVFDRHWRNARTHSVHDPVDWKYHHVGAYLLSGVLPPNHGQI